MRVSLAPMRKSPCKPTQRVVHSRSFSVVKSRWLAYQTTLAHFFDHPEIVVEPLPKYAPELNPEEYYHGNVKAWEAYATP